MSITRYFLGCPVWSRKDWIGELFPAGTRQVDMLRRYADIFNAVEGNTTFYAVPSASTVARWCEQVPADFSFCCKFPRAISHERRLRDADDAARAFLARLAPLATRLGPTFVQLPPSFGPDELPALKRFFDQLPLGRYAVEVRHPAFFADTLARRELDHWLRDRAIDRVILDTRALHSTPARIDRQIDSKTADDWRAAQQQKPRLPLHLVATSDRPIVRFVGHPLADAEINRELLTHWAQTVVNWVGAGKVPHVFMHMPNDFYAPRVARIFHDLLADKLDVGQLPAWPIATPAARAAKPQLDLF